MFLISQYLQVVQKDYTSPIVFSRAQIIFLSVLQFPNQMVVKQTRISSISHEVFLFVCFCRFLNILVLLSPVRVLNTT